MVIFLKKNCICCLTAKRSVLRKHWEENQPQVLHPNTAIFVFANFLFLSHHPHNSAHIFMQLESLRLLPLWSLECGHKNLPYVYITFITIYSRGRTMFPGFVWPQFCVLVAGIQCFCFWPTRPDNAGENAPPASVKLLPSEEYFQERKSI